MNEHLIPVVVVPIEDDPTRLAEAWDKGYREGAIAAKGFDALDNPYRVIPPPTPEQVKEWVERAERSTDG